MSVQTRATLDDLARVEGKAELVGGRIVEFLPTGHLPGRVAFRIARSLGSYAEQIGRGEVHGDNVGYAVPELPSGRESFSPDASYYDGPLPANPMRFIEGPPTFAVEVRSEGDYGPAADAEYATKRDDYFQAGTRAVWDVDPLARTITAYRADAPATPKVFRPGDTADAEPAVPGWRVVVDRVFA
jgi:Uma2 family endonuclease